MANRNQIQDDANELFHEYNRVELIKKYIHNNIKSDLRASILSRKFELSVSTLQHLFKKHQQQSYHRYVEEARMNKAFDMITKDGYRVQQTMYATGYKYRSAFNKAFKREFKHPPSFFQK